MYTTLDTLPVKHLKTLQSLSMLGLQKLQALTLRVRNNHINTPLQIAV